MLKTLELLQDDLIKGFEVLDFKGGERFYYIKIRATLIDGSELHIREFLRMTFYIRITGRMKTDLSE